MASKKVSVTITFVHDGTIPPVYLAGSFSEPPWTPQEMEYTVENGQHRFTKQVDLQPEVSYQYKFRLGHEGNWWVLDEAAPKDTDAAGNSNNVIAAAKATPQSRPTDLPSPPTSESHKSDQEVPTPTLIVERANEKPAYGDDFGPDATTVQKDAHDIRAADAQPDFPAVHNDPSEEDKTRAETADEVAGSAAAIDGETPLNPKIRSLQGQSDGASTPIGQVAETAAEVADSAAALDREPTPQPSSDEEAGRTGERRMSATPIQEVAATASEVADSAALIDEDQDDEDDEGGYGSGAATPAEDRAPMFAYELVGEVDTGQEVVKANQEHEPEPEFENYEDVDPNDPTIEKFPEDREGILSKINTTQTSLSPDETRFEGVPLSPVVGPTGSPMFGRGISESPISPTHKTGEEAEREPTPPPLDAIKEDEEEPDTEDQPPAVTVTKTDSMGLEDLDDRLASLDENEPLSLESGESYRPTPGSLSGITAPLPTAEPTPSLDMLDRLHGGILSGAGASSRGADGNTPQTGEEKKASVSHLSSVPEDAPKANEPQADTPLKEIEEQKLDREIEGRKKGQSPAKTSQGQDAEVAVERAKEYGKGVGAKVADTVKKFEAQAVGMGSEVKQVAKQTSSSALSQVDGGRSVSGPSAAEQDTDAMDHVTGQHVRLDGSNNTATSSAVDADENSKLNASKLTKRQAAQLPERPRSAQSLRPPSDETGKPSRNWLRSIWNTVIFGWFGGLMRKLGLWGGAGGLGERAAGGGRRQLVSVVVLLGLVVPALLVVYAETKRLAWPGEEVSMWIREWVARRMETIGMAWTVARLVVMGRNRGEE